MGNHSLIVGSLTAVLGAACSSTQPTPACLVGRDTWIAKYTQVSGSGSGSCVKTGELLGIQKFGTVGQAQPLIAIRPDGINPSVMQDMRTADGGTRLPDGGTNTVTSVLADYPGSTPSAVGALNADAPDSDHFCTVPTLEHAVAAELPPCTDPPCLARRGSPNTPIDYSFSNVKIWVTPNHPFGTQAKGSLTLSTNGGACVATYDWVALWPAMPSGRGNNGNTCNDDSDCALLENLSIGQRRSSGIDNDNDVVCDTTLPPPPGVTQTAGNRPARGFCMLRCNDIPCLKPGVQP